MALPLSRGLSLHRALSLSRRQSWNSSGATGGVARKSSSAPSGSMPNSRHSRQQLEQRAGAISSQRRRLAESEGAGTSLRQARQRRTPANPAPLPSPAGAPADGAPAGAPADLNMVSLQCGVNAEQGHSLSVQAQGATLEATIVANACNNDSLRGHSAGAHSSCDAPEHHSASCDAHSQPAAPGQSAALQQAALPPQLPVLPGHSVRRSQRRTAPVDTLQPPMHNVTLLTGSHPAASGTSQAAGLPQLPLSPRRTGLLMRSQTARSSFDSGAERLNICQTTASHPVRDASYHRNARSDRSAMSRHGQAACGTRLWSASASSRQHEHARLFEASARILQVRVCLHAHWLRLEDCTGLLTAVCVIHGLQYVFKFVLCCMTWGCLLVQKADKVMADVASFDWPAAPRGHDASLSQQPQGGHRIASANSSPASSLRFASARRKMNPKFQPDGEQLCHKSLDSALGKLRHAGEAQSHGLDIVRKQLPGHLASSARQSAGLQSGKEMHRTP